MNQYLLNSSVYTIFGQLKYGVVLIVNGGMSIINCYCVVSFNKW